MCMRVCMHIYIYIYIYIICAYALTYEVSNAMLVSGGWYLLFIAHPNAAVHIQQFELCLWCTWF
jgi:hypothetical protein